MEMIMPFPEPRKNETRQSFMQRCMGDDAMSIEFTNASQRYAVCQNQWEDREDKEIGSDSD
jgi:hypothetical protein